MNFKSIFLKGNARISFYFLPNLFHFFFIFFSFFYLFHFFFYRCCPSDLKITQNTCVLFRLDIEKVNPEVKFTKSICRIFNVVYSKFSTGISFQDTCGKGSPFSICFQPQVILCFLFLWCVKLSSSSQLKLHSSKKKKKKKHSPYTNPSNLRD